MSASLLAGAVVAAVGSNGGGEFSILFKVGQDVVPPTIPRGGEVPHGRVVVAPLHETENNLLKPHYTNDVMYATHLQLL